MSSARAHAPCSSAYYIAPEIFRRKYTKAVDAWALGVILYLLLSGEVPFGHDADTETEVYHAIQTAPLRFKSVWNGITPYARELVTGLLEKDASKRYTIEQALVHPWVVRQGEGGTVLDRSIITSLTAFDQRNKLQKLVLKTVADKLKANDVQQLRESFMEIDADNTGYITVHELRAALLATGYAAGDVDAEHLLRQVDTDGDRRISWQVRGRK
ncbi:hypothetical protein EON66_04115 [archaeon]|nr:MAG: hypothetical protein EON66_04115 [archaeon]